MKVRLINSRYFKYIPPFIFGYKAIVLGRLILMNVDESSEKYSEILSHEMIHQMQMSEHGIIKFYLIYLKDYVKNLIKYKNHNLAYRNIPFEKEAYNAK